MSKALETLKNTMYYLSCCNCQYNINDECSNKDECCWKTIEKELKAFEIIKKHHQLNFDIIYLSKDFYEYVDFNCFKVENCDLLSKEEYDLLKEVLLWE